MTMADEQSAAAAVDGILARAGLPVTDAERHRLARIYPDIRRLIEQVRAVDPGQAEPALIFPAD